MACRINAQRFVYEPSAVRQVFFVVEAEDSPQIQENEKSEKPPGSFHPQNLFPNLGETVSRIQGDMNNRILVNII